MEILCAPNVNHDVADNLDKINGYLDALADFCTPESNVRADFYIEKTEIETIDLESLIHYYRDVLEINMVCSQIESFVNQSDVFQSIQNILKKMFRFEHYIFLQCAERDKPVVANQQIAEHTEYLTNRIMRLDDIQAAALPKDWVENPNGRWWYESYWEDLFLLGKTGIYLLHLGFSD